MNVRTTIRRRAVVAATGAALALLSVSAGAAMTASAASDPNNEPGQVVTDWDPASGGLWGTGTGGLNGGGTGIDWVQKTFSYDGTDAFGNDSYIKNDGTLASAAEKEKLADVMNYGGGCSSTYNSPEVVCGN